jgi:hypothetical protein
VWVGNTPVTRITSEEREKLHKLMKKPLAMRRKKYPEVPGKGVDGRALAAMAGAKIVSRSFATVLRQDLRTFGRPLDICDSARDPPTAITC